MGPAEPARVLVSCETLGTLVHQDTVLRAITDDGAFRVIAADTTATVRGAIDAQRPEGLDLVRIFADLLTGAVLVRESMAPDNRLQAILQGDDPRARMVAATHPDGATRGLIQLPAWKPMHLQPVFEGAPLTGGAVSEELFERGVCLPSGSAMTEYDLERVVTAVRKAMGG